MRGEGELGIAGDEFAAPRVDLAQRLPAGEIFGILADPVVDYPVLELIAEMQIFAEKVPVIFNNKTDLFDHIFAVGERNFL